MNPHSHLACCVPGCDSKCRMEGISFHSFPRNEALKQKWIDTLNTRKIKIKFAKVCSRHFLDRDYFPPSPGDQVKKRLLRRCAIPSQNLYNSPSWTYSDVDHLENKLLNSRRQKLGEFDFVEVSERYSDYSDFSPELDPFYDDTGKVAEFCIKGDDPELAEYKDSPEILALESVDHLIKEHSYCKLSKAIINNAKSCISPRSKKAKERQEEFETSNAKIEIVEKF